MRAGHQYFPNKSDDGLYLGIMAFDLDQFDWFLSSIDRLRAIERSEYVEDMCMAVRTVLQKSDDVQKSIRQIKESAYERRNRKSRD